MSLEKRTEELTKRSDSHSDRASASTHVDSLTSEGHISHKKREKRKADSALNGVQYNRPSPRERGSSRRDRRGSNERYESGEAEITHSEASPSSETIQDGDDPTGSKRSLRARKARKLDDGRRSIYGEIPPAHDGAEDGASSDGFEIVEEEVAEKPSAKLEGEKAASASHHSLRHADIQTSHSAIRIRLSDLPVVIHAHRSESTSRQRLQ